MKLCLIPFLIANCAEVAETEMAFGGLPGDEAELRRRIPANTGFTGTEADLSVRDADSMRSRFRGLLSSDGVAVALRYRENSET
jgi:hypothetical protein